MQFSPSVALGFSKVYFISSVVQLCFYASHVISLQHLSWIFLVNCLTLCRDKREGNHNYKFMYYAYHYGTPDSFRECQWQRNHLPPLLSVEYQWLAVAKWIRF